MSIARRARVALAATVAAMAYLLGPGFGLVNATGGPAADTSGEMSWPELATVAPEDALVRAVTALGLVLAARLVAAVLLAFIARVPGQTGVRAARLSYSLTPPLARRFVHVIISVSLSSWTGIAVAAPALAETAPVATAVPTPVLAPPEAMLQTWPDLGRPGRDVPSSPTLHKPQTPPAPQAPPTPQTPGARAVPFWPDLGRPTANISSGPRPTVTQRAPAPTRTEPVDSPNSPAGRARLAPHTGDVVVAPGDCLWALAERELESQSSSAPTAADIAAATEKWWQANRATIGADPDRLTPGEHLRPPD